MMAVSIWLVSGCSSSSVPVDGGVQEGGLDADASDADSPTHSAHDADDVRDEPDVADDGDVEAVVCDDPADLPVIDRGELVVGAEPTSATIDACTAHGLPFVAPLGSELELEVTARGMYGVAAAIVYPDAQAFDRALVEVDATPFGGPATVAFEPRRSGEFVVLLRSAAVDVAQGYDVAIRCVSGCDLETTRFPIVLVHGWTGFDRIGPLEYFYEVPETLESHGYSVFVAQLDPYNSIEVRAEQLAVEVDEALRNGRAREVNLIAHSQGGLDSRQLITNLGYGDRVSSLTTIATPHRGTPLCDVALGLLPGAGEAALSGLLNLLGATAVGSESDAEASFASMTEDYVQNVFNPATPDDPRVSYISWTGRTCLYGISCDDVCDIEIRWSYDIIYALAGDNDGIVPVSSASWGDYRGEVPADHFDEVGQLFGVTNDSFDHRAFYLERARDLAAEGH